MTLFDLTAEYKAILAIAEDEETDPDIIAFHLEEIGGEIEDKADSIAYILTQLYGDVETLKKEEERRQREQARLEREQERQEKAAARKQAAAPKPVESKYHCNDVALWLSEKYDFTQTAGTSASCTMFSTAVKDVEMAKLAIKNALKGSNARLAVPWRMNNETRQVETGYTVDDHVLVFTIGKNEDENITVTITEVSNDDFELFKQSINN